MPNHVYVVLTPLSEEDRDAEGLSSILHTIKRYTAREANRILNRGGAFWQHDSYDHLIRDEGELQRVVDYVLLNPVSAGLVSDWKEWPLTYTKFDLS